MNDKGGEERGGNAPAYVVGKGGCKHKGNQF